MTRRAVNIRKLDRYNSSQQQKADNAAPSQPHVHMGITTKKYITKQDILDLLQYEKDSGYRFNRMPNDAFIAQLNGDEKMPVILAMIHNGVEVRVFFDFGSVATLEMDMPFSWFFQINESGNQSCIELDKPSKGFDVIRYLSKADINSLRNYNEAINGSVVNLPSEASMSEMADDDCYEIVLTTVHPAAGMFAHYGNGYTMYVPFTQYFTLTKEVRPWRGWFSEDATKETKEVA